MYRFYLIYNVSLAISKYNANVYFVIKFAELGNYRSDNRHVDVTISQVFCTTCRLHCNDITANNHTIGSHIT